MNKKITLKKVLNQIINVIYDEEKIDFTGIMCGEYSIASQKDMIMKAIEDKLNNKFTVRK